MRRAVLIALLALAAPTAMAAAGPRLVYTSDWAGPREIYSVDPRTPGAVGQLTFGQSASCDPLERACGYSTPVPSPDGRWIAFSRSSCYEVRTLFLAKANGTARRRVSQLGGCGVPHAVVWAPDSRRLAYVADSQLHVVNADGRNNHWLGEGQGPLWSPAGRCLAFTKRDATGRYSVLWILRRGRTRVITEGVSGGFFWSPDGKRIAVARETSSGSASLEIIRTGGCSGRAPMSSSVSSSGWSEDGRFLSFTGSNGLEVLELTTGKTTTLPGANGSAGFVWSHRGSRLAYDGDGGISIFDARRATTRLLTADHALELEWRPDDGSLAYVVRRPFLLYWYGDLRVVDMSGAVRTIVSAAGNYGGRITDIAWTRANGKVRYRRPSKRRLAEVSANEIVAPWSITRLAADGGRVAYATACGHVFVWTPASSEVVQAQPSASLEAMCTSNLFFSLAVTDDRVIFGHRIGNAGQIWVLMQQTLTSQPRSQELAAAPGANGCRNGDRGFGDVVGSGGLLVFSRWLDENRPAETPCAVTTQQTVYRAEATGCPCPELGTSPGPFIPTDVSDGRVAVVGTNAVLLLDAAGRAVLELPVHALTAQLSGSSLVILLRGALREYDAATGALRHVWPLPDVPSGGECGNPHPLACSRSQLVLHDAARGLATYVLDGQVHLVRLADGRDSVVGRGTLARFVRDGLVYADGSRIRLVPFPQLPLRAF